MFLNAYSRVYWSTCGPKRKVYGPCLGMRCCQERRTALQIVGSAETSLLAILLSPYEVSL